MLVLCVFIMFCFLPHSYLNSIYKCQGHDDISSITALVSSLSVIKPTARMALMKNKLLLLSISVILPCRENEVTFMSFFMLSFGYAAVQFLLAFFHNSNARHCVYK